MTDTTILHIVRVKDSAVGAIVLGVYLEDTPALRHALELMDKGLDAKVTQQAPGRIEARDDTMYPF